MLDRIKPRIEEVDVEGYGTIFVRSCPPTKRIKRSASYVDKKGRPLPNARELETIHMLIDQVYADEQTPMFTDADEDALLECDSYQLDPLYEAVIAFNLEDPHAGK